MKSPFKSLVSAGLQMAGDYLFKNGWDDGGMGRGFTGAQRTIAGETVTEESALAVSAYTACLRNIAEDIAKLPLHLYQRLPDGTKMKIDDHPAAKLLREQPNPDEPTTAQAFKESLIWNAPGWGHGLAEIRRTNRGVPYSLLPVHPSNATLKRKAGVGLYWEVTRQQNGNMGKVPVPYMDMLNVVGPSRDGMTGVSILRFAAETIGQGIAENKFGSAFYGNGTHLGGILKVKGVDYDEEVEKNLVKSWNAKHQGAGASHGVTVMFEDVDFQPSALPMRDVKLIEARQFTVEDVARWCRMPLHKIGHLLRSTFSNIEQLSLEYGGDTLQPWASRLESACDLFLLSPAERALGYFFEIDMNGLMRADSAARANFYKAMKDSGVWSTNDVLRKENMPGIGPNGDVRFMPMNMTTLDRIIAGENLKASSNPTPAGESGSGSADGKQQADGLTSAPLGYDAASFAQILRPQIEATANRLARREAAALEKASDRYSQADQFAAWAVRFYGETESILVESFAPILQSAWTAFRADSDIHVLTPAGERLSRLAADYATESSYATAALFSEGEDVDADWIEDVNARLRAFTARVVELFDPMN